MKSLKEFITESTGYKFDRYTLKNYYVDSYDMTLDQINDNQNGDWLKESVDILYDLVRCLKVDDFGRHAFVDWREDFEEEMTPEDLDNNVKYISIFPAKDVEKSLKDIYKKIDRKYEPSTMDLYNESYMSMPIYTGVGMLGIIDAILKKSVDGDINMFFLKIRKIIEESLKKVKVQY